jgi:hypothetical protein
MGNKARRGASIYTCCSVKCLPGSSPAIKRHNHSLTDLDSFFPTLLG